MSSTAFTFCGSDIHLTKWSRPHSQPFLNKYIVNALMYRLALECYRNKNDQYFKQHNMLIPSRLLSQLNDDSSLQPG